MAGRDAHQARQWPPRIADRRAHPTRSCGLRTPLTIEAIAEGYDLTIGIMHNSKRGSHAWALDMIELERSAVDVKILQFVRDHTFAPADFILRKDGCCRLSPQLARVVAELNS
ncbi:CRISPR-associated endonuclease Cas1 [Erythrobacter sp. T5W1-R]|uniref:CRISPR-associated endonuclease Cas1 n=1 Tax=Erythrobacter sp. T5W1-R TaxID=3101752 RepID=UPI002AFE19C4|nr:CRISPR-associated endonuclease Cas1 [Erythrobacter sp. T5W1-R]MEA1619420.1 CRISPR-associated endonuclease Cas1 [Erythrobacter sp. T5W1-R]